MLSSILKNSCRTIHVPTKFLDHYPILISTGNNQRHKTLRQFKFESPWLLEESYQNMFKETLREDIRLEDNMKKVTYAVKDWKCKMINHIIGKKKEILAMLKGIQSSLQRVMHHVGLSLLERKL